MFSLVKMKESLFQNMAEGVCDRMDDGFFGGIAFAADVHFPAL